MQQIVRARREGDYCVLIPDHLATHTDTNLNVVLSKYSTTSTIENLIPDASRALRLWQVYLERVNSTLQMVHVATVRTIVLHTVTNIATLSYDQQALAWSIYAAAAVSLTDIESVQLFGVSREYAVKALLNSTKLALIRFDYLINSNTASLQAFLHFIVCLFPHYLHNIEKF